MKQAIYMAFLCVCAITLGGFLASMVQYTEGLSWLAYSKTLSFEPGTFLNIDVLSLTFGITVSFNIAQLLLIVTAIVIYTKTASKIFTK